MHTGTVASLAWLAIFGQAAKTVSFDSSKPGAFPPGWTIAGPNTGRWEIVKDLSAPSPPYVFAQISKDKAKERCPLALLDKPDVKDGEVSVKVKPVAGQEERAGGLVWRYRDPNNYYLVRANALENNIVLYKVEDGKCMALADKGAPKKYGVKHPVPSNQWSVLKVQFRGSLFSIYFNHKRLFEVVDSTFERPGKVGLWTKADSVTYFDDFRIAVK